MPPGREPTKRIPVVVAPEPGSLFTTATAREACGNRFPITGAHGETKGVGVVVGAELVAQGAAMQLVVEVPTHLTANFESDTGLAGYVSAPR